MSSWLKCCGILDQATDIYLVRYGSWEKYFCCQALDKLLCSLSFNILKIGKGKHEWIKQEQSQKRLSSSTWAMNCRKKISCTSPVSSYQLLPCSGTSHQGMGYNDLQTGSNTKKMGTSVKNNLICNQSKWMEDNALISQLAQPSLELLLKKWHFSDLIQHSSWSQ